MANLPYKSALIVGAGPGIGASVARALTSAGLKVVVAARNPDRLRGVASTSDAIALEVDATSPTSVAHLFEQTERVIGVPEVVLYNASGRVRGAITDLDPELVRRSIEVSAFGAFLVLQQAAKRLVPLSRGAILLTGATASVKGFANSASFAIGKFGLRGLAQSAARELAPKGIHVAHFVIDGAVRSQERLDPLEAPDSTLDPEAIAQTYLSVLAQHRSAWSWEVELRPWVEPY
ncbi:oxidoreductase [Sphingobium lactosutens]|uniref:SDR family NAD(P)-dependent oxidoreductase n=1 Tax=Sphingobium lactosutens TaxID=522773 RepID=UPI0015C13F40|nr:SDR family NAD(P)-dependent oxidoreductase [Sphingobium lactosutens]NWK94299.1 oxidoreductase [Sphingobium lactosutens]